jgi:hypothetical protein
MQVVGSYPCQDSAGCITATIWPRELALRAFRMHLEDQQPVKCLRTCPGALGAVSDYPVIDRPFSAENRSKACLQIRAPGPFLTGCHLARHRREQLARSYIAKRYCDWLPEGDRFFATERYRTIVDFWCDDPI